MKNVLILIGIFLGANLAVADTCDFRGKVYTAYLGKPGAGGGRGLVYELKEVGGLSRIAIVRHADSDVKTILDLSVATNKTVVMQNVVCNTSDPDIIVDGSRRLNNDELSVWQTSFDQ